MAKVLPFNPSIGSGALHPAKGTAVSGAGETASRLSRYAEYVEKQENPFARLARDIAAYGQPGLRLPAGVGVVSDRLYGGDSDLVELKARMNQVLCAAASLGEPSNEFVQVSFPGAKPVKGNL